MTYAPLPRPVTTPDMRERARALLGAAQRKQNLYGQALLQAERQEPTLSGSPAGSPTGAALPGMAPAATLDHMVQHIAQASDHDLLHTHQRLSQARESAQRLAAADTELHAFMAAAYGQAPAAQAASPHATASDVIDVEAHELPASAGTAGTASATPATPTPPAP